MNSFYGIMASIALLAFVLIMIDVYLKHKDDNAAK